MKEDNIKLLEQTKQHKRASTILNLQVEMEGQDLVIELLRELIRKDFSKEDKFVDKLIIAKMSEGPKRVRPPSREELLIQLRQVNKLHAEAQAEYFRLNPEKRVDFQREKMTQVDMSGLQPENQSNEAVDESGFLSDFGLSQIKSTSAAP